MNHSSSALTIVIRMLVGELNSRVRRKPIKPVVFTGAGRSGDEILADKDGWCGVAHHPILRLMRQP